jgi:hypothetical protein
LITELCGVLSKDNDIYFIRFGLNELGAYSMVGPIAMGPKLSEADESIGSAIARNLSAPKTLSSIENADIGNFDRACVEIGFRNADELFRGGLFVQVYRRDGEIYIAPTRALSKKTIRHETRKEIQSDEDNLALGTNFLRALKECR